MAEVAKGFTGLSSEGKHKTTDLVERAKSLQYFFERGDLTPTDFATQAILGTQLLTAQIDRTYANLSSGISQAHADNEVLETSIGQLVNTLTEMHVQHLAEVPNTPAVEMNIQGTSSSRTVKFSLDRGDGQSVQADILLHKIGRNGHKQEKLAEFLENVPAAMTFLEMERGENSSTQIVIYEPPDEMIYQHGYTDYDMAFVDTQDANKPPIKTTVRSLASALTRITDCSSDARDILDRAFAIDTTIVGDETPLSTLERGIREIWFVQSAVNATRSDIEEARKSGSGREYISDLHEDLNQWRNLYTTLILQLLDRNLYFQEHRLPHLPLITDTQTNRQGKEELVVIIPGEQRGQTRKIFLVLPQVDSPFLIDNLIRRTAEDYAGPYMRRLRSNTRPVEYQAVGIQQRIDEQVKILQSRDKEDQHHRAFAILLLMKQQGDPFPESISIQGMIAKDPRIIVHAGGNSLAGTTIYLNRVADEANRLKRPHEKPLAEEDIREMIQKIRDERAQR